jgi:hypothetical protein
LHQVTGKDSRRQHPNSKSELAPPAGATIQFVATKDPETVRSNEIGNLERARAVRREATMALTMSERLARVHALCKQMNAVKGAAVAR